MNGIERRKMQLPSRRVIRLASTMIVLNSVGVWVAVSLPGWPDMEFSMSFKMSHPASELALAVPASPAQLRIQ